MGVNRLGPCEGKQARVTPGVRSEGGQTDRQAEYETPILRPQVALGNSA